MGSAAKQAAKTRIGCGFLVVAALLTCVLLGINGLIVMNLVNAVLPTLPAEWRHNTRIGQAAVFVGPLVLLVIEWWICDVTIDWLKPTPQQNSRGGRSDFPSREARGDAGGKPQSASPIDQSAGRR